MQAMKKEIDSTLWEWWRVHDLFDLCRGKGILSQERQCGDIPYISAKNNNNGLEQLIEVDREIYENVLGWVNDGDGGVGYCFYHPYKFRPSNHVTILKPKGFVLDEDLGLFFATILTLENKKHSRGFSINNKRANETRIKIPTVYLPEKSIDFTYITTFMRSCKNKIGSDLLLRVTQAKQDVLAKQSNISQNIDTSNWHWFRIDELFELKKGKRLISHDFTQGSTPFIGSIENNNGLSAFIGKAPLHTGNVITVNYNGSVGKAFYQATPFWASDDVNVLYPKFELNAYIGLFFVTIIEQERTRFAYGRKWNLKRMAQTRIKVPIKKTNHPDFDYMECFIKSMIPQVEL